MLRPTATLNLMRLRARILFRCCEKDQDGRALRRSSLSKECSHGIASSPPPWVASGNTMTIDPVGFDILQKFLPSPERGLGGLSLASADHLRTAGGVRGGALG